MLRPFRMLQIVLLKSACVTCFYIAARACRGLLEHFWKQLHFRQTSQASRENPNVLSFMNFKVQLCCKISVRTS
uniref:Putative secreted protein n=1 Tax=Rhipicephalus microplus TaxID=6941 RepID=A0A6G5A1G2_RHIMP